MIGGIAVFACLLVLSYPRWLIRVEREPSEREQVLCFFAENLGQAADSLYEEGVMEPAVKAQDIYRGLAQDGAAIKRAKT